MKRYNPESPENISKRIEDVWHDLKRIYIDWGDHGSTFSYNEESFDRCLSEIMNFKLIIDEKIEKGEIK